MGEKKVIHIGVPVLRRYDLLKLMLLSAASGTLMPAKVWVVDNGKQPEKVRDAIAGLPFPVDVCEPEVPLGVAASWNWLIANMPEERIITNDDIVFTADSIEQMRDTPGDLVFGHGYSCYLIRDSAVEKVGKFDEEISPGYAYWEDIDYDMRIRMFTADGGKWLQQNAPCTVLHSGSQTNAQASNEEIDAHHRKFEIAKRNIIAKYAHLPYAMQHPAMQPHIPKT
jgi:GT2 family glycosyltransferase